MHVRLDEQCQMDYYKYLFIVSYRLRLPSAASEVIAVDANPSSSQSPQTGESVPQLWQQQPPML